MHGVTTQADPRSIDLTRVKFKLTHRRHDPWLPEDANAAETRYKNFLTLMLRYPGKKLVPSSPVDEFWHQHILDTAGYAQDCQRVFGHFVHHYPYFGMSGPEDEAQMQAAFADTRELYRREFGEDLITNSDQAECSYCQGESCC